MFSAVFCCLSWFQGGLCWCSHRWCCPQHNCRTRNQIYQPATAINHVWYLIWSLSSKQVAKVWGLSHINSFQSVLLQEIWTKIYWKCLQIFNKEFSKADSQVFACLVYLIKSNVCQCLQSVFVYLKLKISPCECNNCTEILLTMLSSTIWHCLTKKYSQKCNNNIWYCLNKVSNFHQQTDNIWEHRFLTKKKLSSVSTIKYEMDSFSRVYIQMWNRWRKQFLVEGNNFSCQRFSLIKCCAFSPLFISWYQWM